MARTDELTAERLRELLNYDPETHAAYCVAAKRLHGEFANFG